jgi:hypothetical protein
MLLRGVGFTWLLSLPTWGSMWMSYLAPCTVLPPMGVRLEHRVPCLALFFSWSPSFSRESHCLNGLACCDRQAREQSPWIGIALSNHLERDGAGFTSSLPEGERPLGHLALVEKVRVLGGLIL